MKMVFSETLTVFFFIMVQRSRGWVRDEQNPSWKRNDACGWHRQETRGVAPLGSTQEAASERVRVALPGSVRAAPPGRVRVTPREPGSPHRMCTRSPLRRRGVTVPGLMSTICEL